MSVSLRLFRDKLLLIDAFSKVCDKILDETESMFMQGARGADVNEMIPVVIELVADQASEDGGGLKQYIPEWSIISPDGRINL